MIYLLYLSLTLASKKHDNNIMILNSQFHDNNGLTNANE